MTEEMNWTVFPISLFCGRESEKKFCALEPLCSSLLVSVFILVKNDMAHSVTTVDLTYVSK